MLKTKFVLPLILILFLIIGSVVSALTYTSQYPPSHSDTYVKVTSYYDERYYPFFTTDPALSLIGTRVNTQWLVPNASVVNQRFHIDLGSGKVIRRIYYENSHHEGGLLGEGVEDFTFWGSNSAASFAELTYGTDTGWTPLTIAQSYFDIHIGLDQADPKYIIVTNSVTYRYYAFKMVDNYTGSSNNMGFRRIDLQTEDGWSPPAEGANIMFLFSNF